MIFLCETLNFHCSAGLDRSTFESDALLSQPKEYDQNVSNRIDRRSTPSHDFSLKNSLLLALIVADRLHCGLTATKLNCKSKMYETDTPDVHICHIRQFPPPNSERESYTFHMNYAQPGEIKEAHLGTAARVLRNSNLNSVARIPSGIFATFPNLCHFRMSTNLVDLNSGDFTDAMNLTHLDLSDNKLKFIKNTIFSPIAKEARSLSPHSNEVPRVSEGAYSLHLLLELILERNEISEIDANSFYGLNRLLSVSLAGNQLTAIRRQYFAGLPALNRLDVSYNKIELIEDGALDAPTLKQLNLAHNKLVRLSDATFDHVPALESIVLDFNNLEFVGQAFDTMANIAEISMNLNDIQDINLVAFAKLPSLRKLILTQSGFTFAKTQVETVGGEWRSPLSKLNIGGNYLSNAADLSKLRIFPNLTWLGLSWNTFADLDVGGNQTIKGILPTLEMLDLYGNEIDTEKLHAIEEKLSAVNVTLRR